MPAEGAKPPTVISANCHGHNFKPGRIILACGDAGLLVEDLKWTTWGRREAEGSGTGYREDLQPELRCRRQPQRADGDPAVQDRALREGRRHFTRIEYRWEEGSPIAGQPDRGRPLSLQRGLAVLPRRCERGYRRPVIRTSLGPSPV